MFESVMNMPQVLNMIWFRICQGSKYVRVLNILLVLNIPRVLNIPFPKYKKVPFPEIKGIFSGFPFPEN